MTFERDCSARRWFACLVLLPLALAVAQATTRQEAKRKGWTREAAAAYLDSRMDEWFERAQKLRAGDGETSCVSCHTVMPYVLARPALRRAMRAGSLTPQEMRLVEETTRRVDTFQSHELLYESEEEKRDQSHGTEAVLYALILASSDAAGNLAAPTRATRRAMEELWRTQRSDGAWDWLDVGLEPFEGVDSAYLGAALAAIAVGTPGSPTEPNAREGVRKLREYLRSNYARQNLHYRIWGLLGSASLTNVLTAADRDRLVAELQRRQQPDGGWSTDGLGEWRWNRTEAPFHSPGARDTSLAAQPDGYATGLVVYALRKAGIPAGHPVVAKGVRWLEHAQQPVRVGDREWPAWRAFSLNYDREHGGSRGEPWRRLFMSDAATAFASLALIASE